jgi:hypothetical protein
MGQDSNVWRTTLLPSWPHHYMVSQPRIPWLESSLQRKLQVSQFLRNFPASKFFPTQIICNMELRTADRTFSGNQPHLFWTNVRRFGDSPCPSSGIDVKGIPIMHMNNKYLSSVTSFPDNGDSLRNVGRLFRTDAPGRLRMLYRRRGKAALCLTKHHDIKTYLLLN